MQGPSRTAWGVAVHRAVHQSAEKGAIFSDPFAQAILGPDADKAMAERGLPEHSPLRIFVVVRSRFAQDSLELALARGTRQVVVLGAGLDTTALRNPDVPVFEVDHPDTQAWKRERLAQMATPPLLHFVPVDFERESLADKLALAKFDPTRPAFFIWLGVVPYLTRDAVLATLNFVASVPDSEVVFDYGEPRENLQPQDHEHAKAFTAQSRGHR